MSFQAAIHPLEGLTVARKRAVLHSVLTALRETMSWGAGPMSGNTLGELVQYHIHHEREPHKQATILNFIASFVRLDTNLVGMPREKREDLLDTCYRSARQFLKEVK